MFGQDNKASRGRFFFACFSVYIRRIFSHTFLYFIITLLYVILVKWYTSLGESNLNSATQNVNTMLEYCKSKDISVDFFLNIGEYSHTLRHKHSEVNQK